MLGVVRDLKPPLLPRLKSAVQIVKKLACNPRALMSGGLLVRQVFADHIHV
jgi:hypothetical protein